MTITIIRISSPTYIRIYNCKSKRYSTSTIKISSFIVIKFTFL